LDTGDVHRSFAGREDCYGMPRQQQSGPAQMQGFPQVQHSDNIAVLDAENKPETMPRRMSTAVSVPTEVSLHQINPDVVG